MKDITETQFFDSILGDTAHSHLTDEDMMVRAIMSPDYKECPACGVFPAVDEYCTECTKEINDWHDANALTETDLDNWAEISFENSLDDDLPF